MGLQTAEAGSYAQVIAATSSGIQRIPEPHLTATSKTSQQSLAPVSRVRLPACRSILQKPLRNDIAHFQSLQITLRVLANSTRLPNILPAVVLFVCMRLWDCLCVCCLCCVVRLCLLCVFASLPIRPLVFLSCFLELFLLTALIMTGLRRESMSPALDTLEARRICGPRRVEGGLRGLGVGSR